MPSITAHRSNSDNLVMAGGTKLQVVGYASLIIRFQNTTVDLPNTRMVDQLIFPLILGMDWIDASGVCISSHNGVGQVNCKDVNVQKMTELPKEENKGNPSNSETIADSVELIKVMPQESLVKDQLTEVVRDLEAGVNVPTSKKTSSFWATLMLEEETTPGEISLATARGDSIIPANCMRMVLADFSSTSNETIVMVEQAHSFRPGKEWIVPRCIVEVGAKEVKIPVVNLGQKSILWKTITRFHTSKWLRWVKWSSIILIYALLLLKLITREIGR